MTKQRKLPIKYDNKSFLKTNHTFFSSSFEVYPLQVRHKHDWGHVFILLLPQTAELPESDAGSSVNHIYKRMGTGLRNLVNKSAHVKGGNGGLTGNMINKLSRYYRNHIMDYVTKSNDPIVLNIAVEKMQINILAGLHQSVHNDDPSEQHMFCMNKNVKWCKYKNKLGSSLASTSHSKHKKSKLPASFLPYMQPLYQRLSKTELLKRCVAGHTQNQMKHSMLHFGEGVQK